MVPKLDFCHSGDFAQKAEVVLGGKARPATLKMGEVIVLLRSVQGTAIEQGVG